MVSAFVVLALLGSIEYLRVRYSNYRIKIENARLNGVIQGFNAGQPVVVDDPTPTPEPEPETQPTDHTPIRVRKSFRQRQQEYEWTHNHLNHVPVVIYPTIEE